MSIHAEGSMYLGPAEVQRYREEGWLKCGRVLNDEELAFYRSHVDELVSNLPPGKRPEDFNMIHTWDDAMMRLCSDPKILDLVESIIGENIALFASHLICKPGGDGKAAPWHQDSTYWPLDPMEVVTVWLAIDDATTENGCMRVIPRTHVFGELPHHETDTTGKLLHLEMDIEQFKDWEIVDCVLKAGECTLHDARLVHGSTPNTSIKRRAGHTMRFMPTTTKLIRKQGDFYEHHPLYLLRGKDEKGVNSYVNV